MISSVLEFIGFLTVIAIFALIFVGYGYSVAASQVRMIIAGEKPIDEYWKKTGLKVEDRK